MLSLLDTRSLAPPAFLKLDPVQPPPAAPAPGVAAASVSVAIPTQRRPEGLAVAVCSVFHQTGVDFSRLELVVVDNDIVPSAEPLVRDLAAEAPFPVRYVHEPAPGVANARNALVAHSKGDLIAFLDDDEEATPGWLAALLEAQARYDADAVFGLVRARAPARIRQHRVYLEQFFSREGPDEAGVIAHFYGCGDSLVRRAALPHPTAPFSAARNEVGGEDDLLFDLMNRAGARFAWSPQALVYEDPAPSRLTLRYAMARAFAFGQGPSYGCATSDPPDWLGVVRFMAIGVAQTGLFGLLAAFDWLRRAEGRAYTLDRTMRGLGKIFFGGPFEMKFYGRSSGS